MWSRILLWHLYRSSGAVRFRYTRRDEFPNIRNFPIQVCIFCRYRNTESFIQHIISYPYSLDSCNSNKHSDMTCQHYRKHSCMSGLVKTPITNLPQHARDCGVRFLFFRFSKIMVLFWNKAVVAPCLPDNIINLTTCSKDLRHNKAYDDLMAYT